MMGLEAVGKTLCEEIVFREHLFRNLTGLKPGEELSPSKIAKVFYASEGLFKGAPSTAQRIAFLNKADLIANEEKLLELADLLIQPGKTSVSRVVAASLKDRTFYGSWKKDAGYLS
jgi:probable selenium-dependent hydroxylase accessory protein YqeC